MNWYKAMDDRNVTRDKKYSYQMDQDIMIFQKQPFFKGLSLEVIKLYAYLSKEKYFQKDEFIFHQGDSCQEAYLICSGEVQAILEYNHKVFYLDTWKPMDFFGYLALLAKFQWPLSTRALTDVCLVTLERSSFQTIMTRYPQDGMIMIERFVQARLERMKKHMHVLMSHIDNEELAVKLNTNFQMS
jgi:CRP-like cAMP-binding protein